MEKGKTSFQTLVGVDLLTLSDYMLESKMSFVFENTQLCIVAFSVFSKDVLHCFKC